MSGARPEQAALTRDTDMAKTEDTRRVIEGMVDGLNDHRIDDIGAKLLEQMRHVDKHPVLDKEITLPPPPVADTHEDTLVGHRLFKERFHVDAGH